MEDPKGRPVVPFERIEPGEPVGKFDYELSEELVARHREATDQERYADPALAPVSILAADGVQLADRFWDISQSVHAGQRLEVVRVPRIGESLAVRGTAREKFTKKGRRYVVTDTLTTDARGDVVARGVTTGVLVYAEGAGDGKEVAAAPRPPETEPLPVLQRLGPLVRTMTLEKMRLYAEPGEQSIHTDHAFAREAGLPAAIATGTQFMAYVFDLLYRTYGIDAVPGTTIDVRIRLPVFAGDRIETEADLLSREKPLLLHAVRCRVARGDAIAGRAWVPAR
jgi:acyl dehydratase